MNQCSVNLYNFALAYKSTFNFIFFRGEAIPGAQLLMGDIPNRLQQDVSFEELNEIICKVDYFCCNTSNPV